VQGAKGGTDEERIRRAAEAIEPEERRQMEGVVNDLEKSIEGIPPGYFEDLRARLAAKLGVR
jgi:hypothetical protein